MRFLPPFFLVLAALGYVPAPAWAAEGGANAVFLVARRGMADPNFAESVVLVTHSSRGVPLGVIVNRPLDQLLSEVFPDQPRLQGRKEVLYFGGPVARQGLVFLVRSNDPPAGVIRLLKDVFFTADIELIEKLLAREKPLEGLRIFAGYAGWGRGQLQSEVSRGGWHIVPADAELVFRADPSTLWHELIERATTRQTKAEDRIYYGGRMAEEVAASPLFGTHHSSPITHHAFTASEALP